MYTHLTKLAAPVDETPLEPALLMEHAPSLMLHRTTIRYCIPANTADGKE
jgi:hypothetical protein